MQQVPTPSLISVVGRVSPGLKKDDWRIKAKKQRAQTMVAGGGVKANPKMANFLNSLYCLWGRPLLLSKSVALSREARDHHPKESPNGWRHRQRRYRRPTWFCVLPMRPPREDSSLRPDLGSRSIRIERTGPPNRWPKPTNSN